MSSVIQINPEITGDRAATLLLLEKLRFERDRIQTEIDRITKSLDDEIRLGEGGLFDRSGPEPR